MITIVQKEISCIVCDGLILIFSSLYGVGSFRKARTE
jgi:hypothetical protein